MASFNKVILLGNLTRDPEMRMTATGMAICKFGLAVNRVYNTKEGERKEETTFVDIDAFGRQAETISKYMTKGRPLMIEGRLKLDQWETPQGEKRSRLGVVLESFQFVGGRDDGAAGGASDGGTAYEQTSPPPRQTQPEQSPATPAVDDIDEDVPF